MAHKRKYARRVAVGLAVLALGATGFSVGSAVASDGTAETPTDTNYAVNAAGQTYGVDPGVDVDNRPDLILAEGSNGQTGYIERDVLDELTGADVATPEEAAAWEKSLTDATWDSKTIPVFESDGTTQIDVFEISRGDATDAERISTDQ